MEMPTVKFNKTVLAALALAALFITPETVLSEIKAAQSGAGSSPAHAGDKVEAFPKDFDRYGPVKMGDTLSNIAYTLFPDGSLQLEQIMWAIYKKNPQAFIKNNINHLKQGAVLAIPDKQSIAALKPDTASRNVQQSVSNPEAIRQLKMQLQRTRSDFEEQLSKQELLKLRLLELEKQAKQLLQQNSEIDKEFQTLQDKKAK